MKISNADYRRFGFHVVIDSPSHSPISVPAHVWRIQSKDRCSFCGIEGPIAAQCDECRQERYCSDQCRNSAKEVYHEIECGILSKLGQVAGAALDQMTDSVRNFIRLYSTVGGFKSLPRVGREGRLTKFDPEAPYSAEFEALGHNGESISELLGLLYGSKKDLLRNCSEANVDSIVLMILRILTTFDPSCRKELTESGNISLDTIKMDVANTLGVICMNAFELQEGGFVVSANAAMLNHSSAPTHALQETFTAHSPPRLAVRTLEGLTLSKGDQAFISYRNDDITHYYGIGE